jgi:hypothetical protein
MSVPFILSVLTFAGFLGAWLSEQWTSRRVQVRRWTN